MMTWIVIAVILLAINLATWFGIRHEYRKADRAIKRMPLRKAPGLKSAMTWDDAAVGPVSASRLATCTKEFVTTEQTVEEFEEELNRLVRTAVEGPAQDRFRTIYGEDQSVIGIAREREVNGIPTLEPIYETGTAEPVAYLPLPLSEACS